MQLQRRRLQRRQHLFADKSIQSPSRKTLAFLLAVRRLGANAAVTKIATAIGVVDHQTTATTRTDEQATQERGPTPRRPACLLTRPIFLQTLLIGPEAFFTDVGRTAARQQHQALRR